MKTEKHLAAICTAAAVLASALAARANTGDLASEGAFVRTIGFDGVNAAGEAYADGDVWRNVYPGTSVALDGLAFLFADRTNAVGEVYAQLWDIAARAPQGILLTDNGVAYRGVALPADAVTGHFFRAEVETRAVVE